MAETYGLTEEEYRLHYEYTRGSRTQAHKIAHSLFNTAWKSAHRVADTTVARRLRDKEAYYANRAKESETGYSRYFLANTKARAKRKGVPFDLSLEDLVIPECCPVLGMKLVKRLGHFADESPSIDRIVPSLGYTKGNVRIISYRANRIKCHASREDLEKILDYMRKEGL